MAASSFLKHPTNRIMVADIAVRGASLAASKPRPWMDRQLLDTTLARNYAVLPDAKHLVILPRPDQPEKKGPPRVVFLLNFFDELKRRIP